MSVSGSVHFGVSGLAISGFQGLSILGFQGVATLGFQDLVILGFQGQAGTASGAHPESCPGWFEPVLVGSSPVLVWF